MSAFDFDLFVIGGGSGGVRAARIAAGHGARVAIAEEYRVWRHLRDPRLRTEEIAGLCFALRGRFEDAAGFGWSVGKPRSTGRR